MTYWRHRYPGNHEAPATIVSAPRKRRGAAAVEMAVVAPFLFAMLLGSIEFGRAMMVSNLMTSAAREGARVAVLPGGASSDVTTAVNNDLTSVGITASNATITVLVNGAATDASTANSGDNITVRVSVPYGKVTWLPSAFFLSGTSNLTGQAVMRRE
ncbi:hypothetical protein BH10PLA2_BH10PLA2_16380 [soil metagenome]